MGKICVHTSHSRLVSVQEISGNKIESEKYKKNNLSNYHECISAERQVIKSLKSLLNTGPEYQATHTHGSLIWVPIFNFK